MKSKELMGLLRASQEQHTRENLQSLQASCQPASFI